MSVFTSSFLIIMPFISFLPNALAGPPGECRLEIAVGDTWAGSTGCWGEGPAIRGLRGQRPGQRHGLSNPRVPPLPTPGSCPQPVSCPMGGRISVPLRLGSRQRLPAIDSSSPTLLRCSPSECGSLSPKQDALPVEDRALLILPLVCCHEGSCHALRSWKPYCVSRK